MLRFIVFFIGIPLLVLSFILTAILTFCGIEEPTVYIGTFVDWWVDFVFYGEG